MTTKQPKENSVEEKIIKQFEERFDKPLSDEAVKLYHLLDKSHVYFDNSEIKSFLKDTIKQVREDERNAIREMIEGKGRCHGMTGNDVINEILSDPLLKEDE